MQPSTHGHLHCFHLCYEQCYEHVHTGICVNTVFCSFELIHAVLGWWDHKGHRVILFATALHRETCPPGLQDGSLFSKTSPTILTFLFSTHQCHPRDTLKSLNLLRTLVLCICGIENKTQLSFLFSLLVILWWLKTLPYHLTVEHIFLVKFLHLADVQPKALDGQD